jgi:hypothetical protein
MVLIIYKKMPMKKTKTAAFGLPFVCAPSMGAILEVEVLP